MAGWPRSSPAVRARPRGERPGSRARLTVAPAGGDRCTLTGVDFWTQLQAAACFTYGSGNAMALLKQGEAFARQAIDIDPASAGGYGVLARNLNLQVRPFVEGRVRGERASAYAMPGSSGRWVRIAPGRAPEQGRHAEVVPLAAMLLNCRHEEVTKVLVLDTVRCLRIGAGGGLRRSGCDGRIHSSREVQCRACSWVGWRWPATGCMAAYQKTNAPSHVFPETLAALGRVHTAWAADIDAVSREATCCVM